MRCRNGHPGILSSHIPRPICYRNYKPNLLHPQDIDIALTGLTITQEREVVVDFTYPFWTDMQAFGVLYVESATPLLLRPLSRDVWMTYFAMAIFISIVLWSSEVLTSKTKVQSIAPVDKTTASKYHDIYMFVIGAVFYQGELLTPFCTQTCPAPPPTNVRGRVYWIHFVRPSVRPFS